jgi:hypothetical protein
MPKSPLRRRFAGGKGGWKMSSTSTKPLPVSDRDRQYTPHEHEELRAVVTRWRDRRRPAAAADIARVAPQTAH